jgi:hypothetical protein
MSHVAMALAAWVRWVEMERIAGASAIKMRWNPQALISCAWPLQTENGLRVKVGTTHRAAQMWTLIINRMSDWRPIALTQCQWRRT